MLTVIVLAAGMSRRMGPKNKLLLPFQGKTMLETTLDQLRELQDAEIVVVLGHEAVQIQPLLENLEVKVVLNPDYTCGMTSSIQAGVRAAAERSDGFMICLSDMPLIQTVSYRQLADAFLEKSNYRAEKAAGKAIGIAITNSFGSTAAYAVTVTKKGAGVKIDKVVGVIDCGMTINPDTVRAQTEGNVVMALSTAIKPGITFVGGEAQESNFNNYPLLSFQETPPIEIHIMQNQEKPGGAGEPGLPPFAPALFNAVFLATGKRVLRLPVDLENLG